MFYRSIGRPLLTAVLAYTVGIASVWANDNSHKTLTLQQAILYTEKNNALLRQYPYQQMQAQAMAEQAKITPLPELELEAENILGSGNYQSLDSAVYTLTLSKNIELGGKANSRLTLAQASGDYEQAEFALTRLDVLAETSRRFYQLLKTQAMQRLLEKRLQQEQQALATLKKRASAGVVRPADVDKLALRQAQTQSWQQRLDLNYELQKLRLSSMWQAEARFDNASGELLTIPVLPQRQQVIHALQKSPAILQQQALLRLADAQVSRAESIAKSDVNVGLGLRHIETTADNTLTLSFSMPLAFKNPNAGRIQAAKAQQQLNQWQQQQQMQQLTLQLLEYQMQLTGFASELQTINEKLLPRAQSLLDSIQQGFKKGRYSVLQWTDAEAERFTLEQQRITLSHRIYLYLLEIERITGQSVIDLQPQDNTHKINKTQTPGARS